MILVCICAWLCFVAGLGVAYFGLYLIEEQYDFIVVLAAMGFLLVVIYQVWRYSLWVLA